MLYIKESGGAVVIAGTVANQAMLDDGYVQYAGTVPPKEVYEHYELDASGNLIVVMNTISTTDAGGVVTTVDDPLYATLVKKDITTLLDDTAKTLEFNSMVSARAVAGIPLLGTETVTEAAIHADAVRLARWYLKVWGKAKDIETDIVNSVITRPTVDAFLALLPVFV